MRAPPNLVSLLEDGLIEAVLRPVQGGKEAHVFLVLSDGEERIAKVYKEANDRTFKHRSVYAEGRGTRNSRDRRAMKKRCGTLMCLLAAVAACVVPTDQGVILVSGSDAEHPRLRYLDGQLSLNSSCGVRTGNALNPGVRPLYVNGSPIGFC